MYARRADLMPLLNTHLLRRGRYQGIHALSEETGIHEVTLSMLAQGKRSRNGGSGYWPLERADRLLCAIGRPDALHTGEVEIYERRWNRSSKRWYYVLEGTPYEPQPGETCAACGIPVDRSTRGCRTCRSRREHRRNGHRRRTMRHR